MTKQDNIKQPNTTAIVKDCHINQDKFGTRLDTSIISHKRKKLNSKYKKSDGNNQLPSVRYRL